MKPTNAIVGAAAGALVIAGGLAVTGGSDTEEITAIVADASPLEIGNEVRVDGVRVGDVQSISFHDKQSAKVVLTVDKSALPWHDDARLTIRPINVLGENYVAIDPGSDATPFMAGSTLPIEQTSSAVQLQDVLDTFNDPTSAALAALVTTLGEGTRDGGQNVRDALKALAPTMYNLNDLGKILSQQNAVLTELVDRAAPVAKAVAGNDGRELDILASEVRGTLDALGDNQEAIEATIDQLPETLAQAQITLNNLSSVADSVGPTLRRARPVTRDLSKISSEIVNFSKYADPAFNGFGPLFAEANKLLKQAAPIARDLRTAGPNLRQTASGLRPVGDVLLSDHLGDLMNFVTKWALSTNSRDGASHYFRGVVFVTPEALLTMAGGPLATDPNVSQSGKPKSLPETLTDTLTGTVDNTLKGTQDLVDSLTGILGGLIKPRSSATAATPRQSDGGATGLSEAQEQNLLTQLLGGQ